MTHQQNQPDHSKTDRIIEAFRRYGGYSPRRFSQVIPTRKTYAGHRVDWDEGDSRQDDEISDRINRLKQQQLLNKQNKLRQQRLKSQNKVPIKSGKPMFEEMMLDEDLNKAVLLLRQYYYSTKAMRFREWIGLIEKIMDELE